MANILDYFKSKPNIVGVSTFNKLNGNQGGKALILAEDSEISGYQTLIGGLGKSDDAWQAEYQDTNNKGTTPSLLMHAAEIYWGNVNFDGKAQENLDKIDLLKPGRIRTSRDIIAVLEYLLANVGNTTNTPLISLNPTLLSWKTYSTKNQVQSVLASVTYGDSQQVVWTIDQPDNFSVSPLNGPAVNVTPNKHPDAKLTNEYTEFNGVKQGEVSIESEATDNKVVINGNSHIITAKFKQLTKPCSATEKYNAILRASYVGATDKTCTLEYDVTDTQTAKGLEEGIWTWNTTNIDNLGLTISGNNTKSLTITNDTSTDISVEGYRITVSNGNGSNSTTITLSGSFEAKEVEKTYYWYAGQSNPMDMTSISPIADIDGWHEIGPVLNEDSYTAANPLYEYIWDAPGIFGDKKAKSYLALPGEKLRPRYGNGDSACSDEDGGPAWIKIGEKTIENVKYRIYDSGEENLKSLSANIYAK